MIQLGVNIDHVATLRQARYPKGEPGNEPDPARAMHEAELGGADLITVHLREDRRHINDRDVEVIRGLSTSDETYQAVFAFAQSLGKEPITAPDKPGFIVNRLLVPYLLDAVRSYESGLGTVEDIDKGMKLGTGYPMGPFTLLDYVGLDTTYYIANIMFEEYREPAYAPPPLLKRMVLAGRLGKKSGRGFYTY